VIETKKRLHKVLFEKMKMEHIDQIITIEKEAFPSPWSKSAFEYEIQYNDFAHYFVALGDVQKVIGYAGMWVILDEGHITNVATHNEYRGIGLGFSLMLELCKRAILLSVNKLTLEVRPSNVQAIALYRKVGFVEKGVRKKYYSDTQEDAIIMWKEDLLNTTER